MKHQEPHSINNQREFRNYGYNPLTPDLRFRAGGWLLFSPEECDKLLDDLRRLNDDAN